MLALVVIVRADVPELLAIEGGLKAQLAPLGSPTQERLTVPVNPNAGVRLTVDAAEEPAAMVPGDKAVADSPNPGGVVFSTTATPFVGVRRMSGRPSPFISAI